MQKNPNFVLKYWYIFFLCSFLWVKRFDCSFHFFNWDWCKRERVSRAAIFRFNKIYAWMVLISLSVIPKIVFSSKEIVSVEKLWLFGISKIGIFMKHSLKVLAISVSWDRILSSPTRVILERILILSEIFSLTIFQKTLLSVTLLMSRSP